MSAPVFIDPGAHPTAKSYYDMFPSELSATGGFIQVGPRELLPDMTLLNVLDRILARHQKSREFVLVSHGDPSGLKMPLYVKKKQGTGLNQLAMPTLIRNLKGELSDEQAYQILLFKTLNQYKSFKEKLQKVRAMKIQRLALRACDTGQNKGVLLMIKQVFNANSVSAPTLKNVFGFTRPGSPTSRKDLWDQHMRKCRHARVDVFGSPPHRFGTAVSWQGAAKIKIDSITESWAGAQTWVSAKLFNHRYQSGVIQYQALTKTQSDTLIYAGESAFRANLAHV